jgi:hypothetical protein
MRTPGAIIVIAAGAILSLAVSARLPGVNLRLAGVIIILAGIAILLAPPSPAAAWLRRRRGQADPAGSAAGTAQPAGDDSYPDYLLQDPAVLAAEVLNGLRSDSWPEPADAGPMASTPAPAWAPREAGRPSRRPAGPRPLRSVDLGHAAGLGQRDEFG